MSRARANATIRLGISTCPNDTFAFHGLLNGKIDSRGLQFDIQLFDIQQLNERLGEGSLDVAKASFFAALQLAKSMLVLPCGSAIGFGVGPLLLSARPTKLSELQHELAGRPAVVLCPGALTTATFLCQTMLPFAVETQQVPFSEIMPRLADRRADLGACIHEGRFVWREQGLHLVADLGEIWERRTESPLPLGGLLARSDLPDDVLQRVQDVVRDSIRYAHAHRAETAPTMRRYAQEFSDEVLFAHVDLYVNAWTLDLGSIGRKALATMRRVAVERGLLPSDGPALRIGE